MAHIRRNLLALGLAGVTAVSLLVFSSPSRYESGLIGKSSNPSEDSNLSPLTTASNRSADLSSAATVNPKQRIQAFDESLNRNCQAADLQVAKQADWLTVCRRISLSLLGSGMSLQDIRQLEQMPEASRVDAYLESCLADSRWSSYWAERYTRYFVGNDEGPFLLYRRRKFSLWLGEQLRNDLPYDELVQTMIASEGLWTDKPQVNFYTATADGDQKNRADPIRIAGRTARVFLGQRIDCLQCHDDFLGNTNFACEEGVRAGTQLDFHQLAAFFGSVSIKNPLVGLVDDKRPYETALLGQSEPATIEAKVPFDAELYDSSLPNRKAFAKWLTDSRNEHFARATANRVWNLMLGQPLVAPVDHITADAKLIEPLDELAKVLVDEKFSFKQLIRSIVASEAFQRRSQVDGFEPTIEHEQLFAVFPVSRLRPEQIVYSILQASQLTRLSDESLLESLGRYDEGNKFAKRFGDAGDAELAAIAPTVAQRLLLMNGKPTGEATKPELVANAVSRIGAFAASDEQRIEQLYLLILNRYPTADEMQSLLAQWMDNSEIKTGSARQSRRGEIRDCTDVAFALFNCAELQWNH